MTPKRAGALSAVVVLAVLIVFMAVVSLGGFLGNEDPMQLLGVLLPAMILLPVFTWLCVWSLSSMRDRAKKNMEYNIPIDTVILDIGNVLTYFIPREFMTAHGVDEKTQERMFAAFQKNGAWDEYDRGMMTSEEVTELIAANDPEIADTIRMVLNDSFKGLVIKADYAIPFIRSLKNAGYKVYLLSNFSEKALADCKDALEFMPEADGALLSCKEKVIKPDRAIYERLFDKFSLNPAACVFLDDTPKNIDGAIAAGMKGIVFENLSQAEAALEALGVTAEWPTVSDAV